MKKIIIKSAKIIAWIMLSLLLLFTLLAVLIQLPPIQNRIIGEAIEFLEKKIDTKVKLDRVEIGFPKKLIVKGFYLESQEKDTLVYLGELSVDFRFFKLLNNTIDVQSIVLNDFVANIKRDSLQRFNFDYIVDTFASEEKSPKGDKKPFAISLNKIHLKNIALSYDDKYEGNDLHLKFNEFSTKIEELDLEQMNFSVPKIELKGLKTMFKRTLNRSIKPDDTNKRNDTKKLNSTDKENVKPFNVKLKKISLSDIDLAYEDAVEHLSSELILKRLSIDIENIDLPKQEIKIDKIAVSDTQAAVRFLKNIKADEAKEKEKQSDAENENPWKVKLNKLELKRLSVQFDDENAIALKNGMDFKHLNFSSINMEMKNFVFEPTEISGAILSAAIKEKSGFELQTLKADFKYGSQTAFLKNLHLKTAHTNIQNNLVLTYAKQRDLTDNQGEIGVDLDLKNSDIGIKDILLLVPDLEKQDFFKNYSEGKISTSLRAKGKVKDLEIEKFYTKLAESTVMDISGRVKGLPDTESTDIDLKINNLETTAKNLQNFVPKESLPENIELPENLSAEGSLKGYLNNFDTQIELKSSFGAVALTAQWDQRIKEHEKYSADVTATDFELGKLIRNDSLGAISISLQAAGEGLKPQTANVKFNVNLTDAEFNNYRYKDFLLSGNINAGSYSLQGGIKDPNIEFSLNAEGQIKAEELSLQLNADIEKVDLLKLKLNTEPFALKAKIRADFQNLNPDKLQGKLALEDLAMSDGKEIFVLQPIHLKASSKADQNKISIHSQVAELEMQGKYQLTKLPEAVKRTIAEYFDTSQEKKNSAPQAAEEIKDQELKISLLIKDNPLLHQIVPSLNNFKQFELKGSYLSKNNQLQLQAKTSALGYDNNKLSHLLFAIDTEAEALKYKISLLQLKGKSIEINKLSLAGEVQKNILSYNLELKDDKDSVQYLIAGICERVADRMELKILPKGFKLNYENWTVAADNRIIIAKEGINAQSFELSKNDSKIKLQSQSTAADAPLKMEFVNFDLQSITEIVKKETELAKGFIDGELELRNLKKNLLFVSDLKLKQLEVMGAKVGNLSLKVDNNSPNRFNANIALSENGNDLILTGFYDTEQEDLNMKLDIKQFQTKTIEAFTDKMISDAEGSITGKLDISWKASKPSILGKIQFNKVSIHAVSLNSDFKDINDAIEFTSSGIVLNRFEITDSKQNKLAINGRINTNDYSNFNFNLNVLSDNFKAINSTEKDNDLFYGELFLALNLKLTGDLKKPELNGKIGINKNSNLTLVMPHQDPSVADREGVVEFLDQRNQQLVQTLSIKNSVSESDFKGIDVAVAIHTDEEAQFNVIVDKASGDMLKLNGKAELTGGIDPSGKISLTGKYEFSKGSYEMNFNLIKRKFTIQKGSSIIWNGDPMAATLNLTAIYNIRTAPIDLLEKQLSGLTPALRNMYKQKLPFETLLMMKGELLQPEISFDIKLGETSGSVSSEVISNTKSKLEQLRLEPSDLNKQIFALLILSRFIGENPFSGESSNAESIARESVSKILSEQLNQLAGNLIGGVEMDFDLQSTEDYSSGQKENRTDLNVGLSKKLLNDRLKITIGSSFGLEGSERENEKSTNIAGDISAEYLLSKDGRYTLRAYRKNKYQVALQGQIVETGVGFIITMSYERFKELLEAKSKKKKNE